MTELREVVQLGVPYTEAERCILEYFNRYRGPGGIIEIPLRINLADFGSLGGLALERTVTMKIAKQRDSQNLNDEIAVRWEPGSGEPFPSFAGGMTVWGEPETTLVELRGTYKPPMGAAGQFFDDAIGHLIAKHTARQFLLSLAEGAQACYQR